jgi:gluconate 2-dehydrogenase gamma chain
MPEDKPLSRKLFVILGTGAVAAVATPDAALAEPPAKPIVPTSVAHAEPASKHAAKPLPSLGSRPEAYAYLTDPEVAFLEAAVERLIPTDAHGPGAKEAGVAYYIDQQLAGRYGRGDTMYTHGPWGEGLPTQGYQLRLTPAEVYRLGMAGTDAHATKTLGKVFHLLDAGHQDDVLTGLQTGAIVLDDVPATTFFGMLLGDTIQGFFADPMYGGNRDKVGWKTIGFPGVGAVYLETIDKRNVPYVVRPVGIADEMQKSMAMHGGSPVEHVQSRLAGRMRLEELG